MRCSGSCGHLQRSGAERSQHPDQHEQRTPPRRHLCCRQQRHTAPQVSMLASLQAANMRCTAPMRAVGAAHPRPTGSSACCRASERRANGAAAPRVVFEVESPKPAAILTGMQLDWPRTTTYTHKAVAGIQPHPSAPASCCSRGQKVTHVPQQRSDNRDGDVRRSSSHSRPLPSDRCGLQLQHILLGGIRFAACFLFDRQLLLHSQMTRCT